MFSYKGVASKSQKFTTRPDAPFRKKKKKNRQYANILVFSANKNGLLPWYGKLYRDEGVNSLIIVSRKSAGCIHPTNLRTPWEQDVTSHFLCLRHSSLIFKAFEKHKEPNRTLHISGKIWVVEGLASPLPPRPPPPLLRHLCTYCSIHRKTKSKGWTVTDAMSSAWTICSWD